MYLNYVSTCIMCELAMQLLPTATNQIIFLSSVNVVNFIINVFQPTSLYRVLSVFLNHLDVDLDY